MDVNNSGAPDMSQSAATSVKIPLWSLFNRRRAARQGLRSAIGGSIGFILVWSAATLLIAQNKRHPSLVIALAVVVFAWVVLPLTSWLLLVRVRMYPAWAIALGGWFLSITFTMLVQFNMRGGNRPAWVYGLCAACGYGIAGLWSRTRPRPTTQPILDTPPHQ